MATILVVDDRLPNRQVLVDLLGYSGHVVHEACDGAQALTLARSARPDLVITDMLMPRMDGYELVRQMRADPELAATPVIFYTATYQEREARALARKCGVTHLLTKPIEPEEVLRTVEEVLGPGRHPAPAATDPEIDRDHLRLLTDTLDAKVRELEAVNQRLERYAERLAILRRIDRAVLAAHRPRELATTVLHHLHQLIPCWHVGIWVFEWMHQAAEVLVAEGGGVPFFPSGARVPLDGFGAEDLAAIRAEQDRVVEDLTRLVEPPAIVRTLQAAGLRSYALLPLASEGRVIGALGLGWDRAGGGDAEQIEIARQVADQLAIAIRHALLFQQVHAGRERLQALSRQLLAAQEEERRRIARELHDEIGQSLTAVRINLQRAAAGGDAAASLPYLKESDLLVEQVLQQVRTLSLDLRPSVLDDLGLVAAVRWYLDRTARRAGFAGQFVVDPPEIRPPPEIATACFRIVQEALTNVVRHAGAGRVDISLSESGDQLEMLVRDDGAGFDVAAHRQRARRGGSLGLLGMQERVALLGGRLAIESNPGRGTEVRVRLPLHWPESPSPAKDEESP